MMLGGRLGLASLHSWVEWEGGQGGPITVVREGMWGITRLRFFIRGEYSALGCVEGVGWGEGGSFHSVSVLGVVASLLSSLGSCSSGEFTSGAATKTGGSLTMVGLLVSGRGWTVPLLWVGWTVPLMWVGSKVFLKMKICLKINLKLSVVAFKVEVGINSSLPKAVKFSDEAV